jgi:hypothetical protein
MINRSRPLAAVVAALVTAGLFVWLARDPACRTDPDTGKDALVAAMRADLNANIDVDIGNQLERGAP